MEYLFAHSLNPLPEIAIDPSIEIRTLRSGEIEKLRVVWPVNLGKAAERLERGDACYIGIFQNEIVSYHWVQFSGKHYLQQAGRYIDVRDRDAWIYHVRVADHARGRNINSMVYSRILSDMKSGGKRTVYVYTSAKNFANQKGLTKCGFRLERKIYSLGMGTKYYQLFASNV